MTSLARNPRWLIPRLRTVDDGTGRRRITTRTLENAGAFPSDACGARHPPGTAPTARASRNQPSAQRRAVGGGADEAAVAAEHAGRDPRRRRLVGGEAGGQLVRGD